MKVTKEQRTFPLMSFGSTYGGVSGAGPSGSVPTSNGSNGVAWGSNIATITVNQIEQVLGPFVNFADGSNTTVTVDHNPGSAPSNTIRVHASGGGGSIGSNSTDVSGLTFIGAGTSVAPADHWHRGIETVTASSSNTMQRPTLNLRAGSGIVFSLSDTDGNGVLDTLTILGTGTGGGGGGGGSTTREDGFSKPDSPGLYDEEWESTADTLPTGWSWISTPSTWKVNSQWKSWLIVDHPASTSETKELRRSFVPGSIDFGFWWYWNMGLGQWNNNSSWMDFGLWNSGETEGELIRITKSSVLGIVLRQFTGGSESDVSPENGSNNDTRSGLFCGLTRKTSDNTWRAYISSDGLSWVEVGGAHTHSITVDHIRMRFNSGSNVGIERHAVDFIRYRADLLLWAPR